MSAVDNFTIVTDEANYEFGEWAKASEEWS